MSGRPVDRSPGAADPGPGRAPAIRALRGPLLALVVVVVLAIAALVWGITGMGGGAGHSDRASGPVADVSSQAPSGQNPLDGLARRVPGDPLAMGRPNAPVVLIEWADFQCPFCARFARETQPALVKRFVRDGTLRVEWRDFPYFGEQSVLAARAARAAGEQGKFWQFHDAVYALGLPPNSGQLTAQRLVAVAAGLGLDTERFTAAMQSQQTLDAVTADFRQGQSLGITGTPAFVVNGRPVMGAQPLKVFVDTIQQAASQAKSHG